MRFIAIGFLVIGFVILLYIWKNDFLYLPKPQPWPVVKGEVKKSQLVLVAEDDKSGESTFKLAIQYQYAFNSEVFTENSVFLREMLYKSRSKAKEMIGRFEVGQEINVFVNPNLSGSPRSVLVWEIPEIIHPLASIAFLCLAMGSISCIIILVFFLLDRRKTV